MRRPEGRHLPWRRTTLPALLTAVLLAGSAEAGSPPIGAEVPDFQATSLHGETLRLLEAAGRHKAVVLLFLSTVCPYANYFSGHVKDLAEQYGPRGVLFVGIYSNGWESGEEAAAHGREHGFAFPLLRDEGHVIADRLGASRTPEAFVVDSSGRLRYRGRVMSKQESPELKRAIGAVLEGRRVRTPVTKAFGCAIGG
ncbi:MAG TPA: redoxin domain-containing protein [Vicinamibacteria bacterium]